MSPAGRPYCESFLDIFMYIDFFHLKKKKEAKKEGLASVISVVWPQGTTESTHRLTEDVQWRQKGWRRNFSSTQGVKLGEASRLQARCPASVPELPSSAGRVTHQPALPAL